MADALCGSAAEYKHVVLGLIFLEYISDAFEERHALLESEREQGADPEDPDEYRAENIFWVPFSTRTPKPQDRLRVVVAFSGNLDSLGLWVYLYTLDVR